MDYTIIIDLIQSALSGYTSAFSYPIDLSVLNKGSSLQGVAAIVYDGLQKAYETIPEGVESLESLENKPVKYDWFGSVLQHEIDYERYASAISNLATLFSSAGIPMMLLKGYGLSLNYPVPAHRPCGDIDVYLFGWQEEADKLIEEQKGIKINRKNPHHSVFSFEGFTVENHATFLDNNSHKSSVYIEGVIRDLLHDPQPSIDVGGQQIYVPSVRLNSIYLLRHMANHFATEKITLRHLLDWALFVEKNAGDINWEYVTSFAKRTNMHKFLSAVNTICVRDLGFMEEHFPVPYRDNLLATRVLNDILDPEWKGEIPPIREKIRYGLAKTSRLWHNRWKYRIVYDETLLESFWTLARNRVGK